MTFVLAMTLFPETQRRAQEEIDNVVDDDRLPVLSDRPRLPYCDALVKEVMRFVNHTLAIVFDSVPSSLQDGILPCR